MSVIVQDTPEWEQALGQNPVEVVLPNGRVIDLTRGQVSQLREAIGQWQQEDRKSRRRKGLASEAERRSVGKPDAEAWPPEPQWGTDQRGRFFYRDYDGESLHVWRDKDGELWIDKKGEGPVYVRSEDSALIVEAIK